MNADFHCEILASRGATQAARSDWETLQDLAGADHPFMAWDWVDNWYAAFCADEDVRLVVVRDQDSPRAVFPARREVIHRKGLRLRAISAAVNGHSPRFFVLSRAGDLAPVVAALQHAYAAGGRGAVDLLALWAIHDASDTAKAIHQLAAVGRKVQPHVEHAYESPALDVRDGWDKYLATRSRNFRHRYHQAQNRASREGSLALEFIELPGDEATVTRLATLDATTWQHAQRSGLFSDAASRTFYTGLVCSTPRGYRNFVAFLKLDGKDIAYELGCIYSTKTFMLKYGFDPRWTHLRAGVLVQHMLCEHLARAGFHEIDLVGEATEEKAKWATHYRRHENLWLLNRNSIAGRAAGMGLKILDKLGGRTHAGQESQSKGPDA